jgi:hypothetical protein
MGARLAAARMLVTRLGAAVSSPSPGPEYIATLTRLMDAGEAEISDLKRTQRTEFDQLITQVIPNHVALVGPWECDLLDLWTVIRIVIWTVTLGL